MKKYDFWIKFLLLFLGIFSTALGQKIEILYTKTMLKTAMEYKKLLQTEQISNFNALALHNITPKREEAYLKKISDMDAVIILGETGLKATSAIGFELPVIIIDGIGETKAKGPVFHIYNSNFESISSVTDGVNVASADEIQINPESLANGATTNYIYSGISDDQVINKILSEIKRLKSK